MAKFSCFILRVGRKKKDKGDEESLKHGERKGLQTLQVKIEHPVKSSENEELKLTTFSVAVPYPNNSQCSVKFMSHESPVGVKAAEIAYEGEDEHEEKSSIKRDFSDLDLSAHEDISGDKDSYSRNKNLDLSYAFDPDTQVKDHFDDKIEKESEKGIDVNQNGHVSDPGITKAEFGPSPKLQRSCSNVETRTVFREMADRLPPSKSQSFEELQDLSEKVRENVDTGSPRSETTHFSADRVMLKKHSSSQVLPSRSRRLWWKLFLWSHRNLHNARTLKSSRSLPNSAALKPQGGYSSDTLEPSRVIESSKLASPGSFAGYSSNDNVFKSWDTFHNGVSGLWQANQWVAFPSESSPIARVEEWVKDLEIEYPLSGNDSHGNEDGILFPPSPENGRSPPRHTTQLIRGRHGINLAAEILHANSIIQSLNSLSTVAHISGIGLKAIPTISSFSSLRSINLSNNCIVQITPGSLPKGIHTLNLSRNKIGTIEGLRELTRLRVLDLSYNRISKIGHGLSNCTLIKELYLAGNKISDVEGLHRLLKLTVLDLSFNKITTTKALGQLVANYNTLQALNLLGNSIQNNISDDQLRKAVCDLLPKLAYLNKQPIKSQRAREVLTDSVAKAALGGNSSSSSSRKAGKRVSQGRSLSAIGHKSSASVAQKSKNRSKDRTHQNLSLRIAPPAQASSSH
ncbi:hypothetical protein I3843_07G175500 [Carya illinoinensis]|nr:hypothetical protein I3760_07G175900 [Carya illinoinensis]KAG7972297.1 hypothetical protein I3843_07G175500 [Carya illinoinensis]